MNVAPDARNRLVRALWREPGSVIDVDLLFGFTA
jgi:hypothetical protein